MPLRGKRKEDILGSIEVTCLINSCGGLIEPISREPMRPSPAGRACAPVRLCAGNLVACAVRSSRAHEPRRKSAPQICVGQRSAWLGQDLIDRDALIEGAGKGPIKHGGSIERFISPAGEARLPAEQSQDHQLDIGIVRVPRQQVSSFAGTGVHESCVDSCEQLRDTGFAIRGSCYATPDLRDQLGRPI